jgi:hypothetical protein
MEVFMNVRSKGLLKISSILLIVFGAIAAAIPLVGLIGAAKEIASLGGLAGTLIAAMIMIFGIGMGELIVGIVGLKKSGDPAKGHFFTAAGVILCALSLASLVLSIADGSFGITILNIQTGALRLIAFALPFLYIIGGLRFRTSSR